MTLTVRPVVPCFYMFLYVFRCLYDWNNLYIYIYIHGIYCTSDCCICDYDYVWYSVLFVVYFFLEIPTNALLHRLKGSLKGWGLAELDLGECWNLSNSMPLEVQWVACSCWEGNRERMKRLISFADMRMFVLWVAWASTYPCLLLPFARLLPKCCSNFRSELHVHAVSDPSVLKIWLFKWMSTTCHRQSEAPLATAFGSARC